MEYEMIGTQAFTAIILMIAFGIVVPLGLAIAWKIVKKERFTSVLIGAAMFMAFAIVLEAIPKAILFSSNNPVGKAVLGSNAAIVLLGALLAGIFEETGRFVAFRLLINKRKNKETAISYGIGHGGIEIMYLFVSTGVNYLTYAILINSGGFGAVVDQLQAINPDQAETLKQLAVSMVALKPTDTILGFVERISAMMFHVACSVIVFRAVREKGKIWLYPVAILLHTLFDCIAGLYQTSVIKNAYVLEAIIFAMAAAILAYAIIMYKKMPSVYDAGEDEAEARDLEDIRKMGL